MKTSNKLLLGMLLVIIVTIVFLMVSLKHKIDSKAIKGDENIIEITKSLNRFSKISIARKVQVFYRQGETYSCKIEADSNLINSIEILVTDGVLEIDVNDIIMSQKPINVYLSGKHINEISLKEGGRFESVDFINEPCITIFEDGGAYLFLKGNFDTLHVKSNNGATANFTGTCNVFQLESNAGSIVNADSLLVQHGSIISNMGAISNISVEKTMNIAASTGAIINYTGNPEIIKQAISTGAQLSKK